MPWVTESLGRVKHCAGQMCCQERAFAEKKDSCPQDGVGGGRGVKQEEMKYAREGDPTTRSQPLEPQLGDSTSLLALLVLAELARQLASVLIKVVNQFGGCYEKNSSETLMVVHNKALRNSSRLRVSQIISISQGLFNSVSLRFIECQLHVKPRLWPSGSPFPLGKENKGTVDYGIKRNEVEAMIEAHTEFRSVAKGSI